MSTVLSLYPDPVNGQCYPPVCCPTYWTMSFCISSVLPFMARSRSFISPSSLLKCACCSLSHSRLSSVFGSKPRALAATSAPHLRPFLTSLRLLASACNGKFGRQREHPFNVVTVEAHSTSTKMSTKNTTADCYTKIKNMYRNITFGVQRMSSTPKVKPRNCRKAVKSLARLVNSCPATTPPYNWE